MDVQQIIRLLRDKFPEEIYGLNLSNREVLEVIILSLLDRLYRWEN